MKRRWFLRRLVLGGLAFPTAGAFLGGCGRSERSESSVDEKPDKGKVRNSQPLVVATSANYPPYETLAANAKSEEIVGFDVDLAELISKRLGRKLSMVDMEFDELIPALEEDKADMAMAALEPTRSRKQRVDFSDIYYRSQQALVSLEGYLDSQALNYQAIGVRAGSVQDRFANRLSKDYPNIDVVPYDTLEDVLNALSTGAVEAAILEATVADIYLKDYPELGFQIVQDDRPRGSAIALPQNSPLRQSVNEALIEIESSGEMNQLIDKWFS